MTKIPPSADYISQTPLGGLVVAHEKSKRGGFPCRRYTTPCVSGDQGFRLASTHHTRSIDHARGTFGASSTAFQAMRRVRLIVDDRIFDADIWVHQWPNPSYGFSETSGRAGVSIT
jgi:hypothetical protein